MESLEAANGKSFVVGGGREPSIPPQTRGGFFVAQLVLRFLTVAFTAAAIAVMVTARETVNLFVVSITVRYSSLTAFKFLVGANSVICGFSLLSLIFISIFSKGKSGHSSFLVYLHDLVLMVLSMSGCAAAIAVGYVGQYGEEKAAWTAVCGNVNKFCHKAMASMVLSLFAFICLFLLTIIAARNLKRH